MVIVQGWGMSEIGVSGGWEGEGKGAAVSPVGYV